MNYSPNKLVGWLLMASVAGATEPTWSRLSTGGPAFQRVQLFAGSDQTGSASDQKDPPPLKPSRESSARGIRVAFLIGINFFAWSGYSYDTRVTMPSGEQLHYGGTHGAPGGALFLDGAVTLPGALRRVTVGVSMNAGGVNSRQQSVIPEGVMTPFSQRNLLASIQGSLSSGWNSAFSPRIEHDVGFWAGSRVRAGYQYWNQTGSQAGLFRPIDNSRDVAAYDVRLKLSSHLVRLSVNHYLDLRDSDIDPNTPHRPSRKFGLVRQFGVMVGTNRTIAIFAGVGPFWEIVR